MCTMSLVITCTLLLVVVPIVCHYYYTRYWKNQKHWLPYNHTKNTLKEININNKLKMGHKFKDIDIKNCTYYLFDGMINIKNLDQNKIKIDKKSYKNIFIY